MATRQFFRETKNHLMTLEYLDIRHTDKCALSISLLWKGLDESYASAIRDQLIGLVLVIDGRCELGRWEYTPPANSKLEPLKVQFDVTIPPKHAPVLKVYAGLYLTVDWQNTRRILCYIDKGVQSMEDESDDSDTELGWSNPLFE